MDLRSATEIASKSLSRSLPLGFDQLKVAATETRMYGVRIAQGVICRENVARQQVGFEVSGIWQGREAGFSCQAPDDAALVERIRKLRHEVEQQPVDKEAVLPQTAVGRLTWDVSGGDFDECYGPATLYPLVEKHAARARSQGLRVTGYLEAQEVDCTTFVSSGLTLRTRDHGITVNLTVDDPATGAVGASVRAGIRPEPALLDRLIGDALGEALEICQTSAKPREVAPGDYTVVLHPQAVLDIVGTALMYGLFDRRKVDEGRTYLSKKRQELSFPDGLRLAQTLNLPVPGGSYADLPLNGRLVPCADLNLIDGGKIQDLHCSPFWARQTGGVETFPAHNAPPLLLEARAGTPLAGKHATIKDLIADTKQGIYVANTWYLRMVAEMDGTITGMTRDGLYEIKDGKLAGPLVNMRWHDNPFRILSAVTGLSTEQILLGRSRLSGRGRTALALIPALRVDHFHFSSATKF